MQQQLCTACFLLYVGNMTKRPLTQHDFHVAKGKLWHLGKRTQSKSNIFAQIPKRRKDMTEKPPPMKGKHQGGKRERETISKATELFLTSCVPHVELKCPSVCVELERMNFHTHSCDILLLEFTLQG